MRSTNSDPIEEHGYFCDEPWTGVFAIQVNQDVEFCPCYLKMRIGNLENSTMQEIWNADALVEIRRQFVAGRLPQACTDQLCQVDLREPGASSRETPPAGRHGVVGFPGGAVGPGSAPEPA